MKTSDRSTVLKTAAAALLAGAMWSGGAAAQDAALFWSSQATPVTEAQAMRDAVLPGLGSPVDFSPQDPGAFMTRMKARPSWDKSAVRPEPGETERMIAVQAA